MAYPCFTHISGLQGAIWEDVGFNWPWKGSTGAGRATLDYKLAHVGAARQRPLPEQLTPDTVSSRNNRDLQVKL